MSKGLTSASMPGFLSRTLGLKQTRTELRTMFLGKLAETSSGPRKLLVVAGLQASRQDQMHLDGGGMVRALHDEGKRWLNMDLDAAYVLRHCSHCLATSTRGVAEPAPRHLPRPMAAGDILGVDLKKVVPPDGAHWVMLLLVDFATNRLWAFDMDVDKLLGLE